jgi:NTP pyrophosphatase (non-canonical NTP hydrolase)
VSDWQRRVAVFSRRHDLLGEPAIHLLDLLSELGEVAKELLLASDYGRGARVQFRPELAGELGDALYSLLALMEACGVDASSALNAALEKYEQRLAESQDAGSKGVEPECPSECQERESPWQTDNGEIA